MKRKTPTKKDINEALIGLSNNDQIIINSCQILADKVFQLEMINSLILKYDKKLNKFVRDSIDAEVEQIRSENKEGT